MADKTTGDKSTEYKGKSEKHADNAQVKHCDLKSEAKKDTKWRRR